MLYKRCQWGRNIMHRDNIFLPSVHYSYAVSLFTSDTGANQSSYYLSIRVTAFTVYAFVSFVISIILTFRPTTVFPYLFTGSLPLAAFLIFGTQAENFRVWCKYCLRIRAGRSRITLEPITFKPGRFSGATQNSSHSMRTHDPTSFEKRLPPTPTSGSGIV